MPLDERTEPILSKSSSDRLPKSISDRDIPDFNEIDSIYLNKKVSFLYYLLNIFNK